jgi:general secretion pathway protein D
MMSRMLSVFRSLLAVVMTTPVVFLLGCSPALRVEVPAARVAVAPPTSQVEGDADAMRSANEEPRGPEASGVSRLPGVERVFPISRVASLSERFSDRNALTVTVDGLPMRNFINHVFGDLLKVNFIVVDGAPGLDSPVTFSAQKPVSSRQLYRLVQDVLSQRGLGVTEKQGVYFIGPVDAKSADGLPIGFGGAASDVPDLPGDILQIVPLKYGVNMSLQRTVQQLVDAQAFVDTSQNAMFITGKRSAILKVLDLVKLFDQPSVKLNRIGVLSLTFVSSGEFIEQVTRLLASEGIAVGGDSPLSLVPLDRLGAVVVFAASEAVLERVEFWTKQIDKPGVGTAERYFIYNPRYSRASDLGQSLAPLIGGAVPQTGNLSRDTRSSGIGDTAMGSGGISGGSALRRDTPISTSQAAPISVTGQGVTLSVDPRSNSLILYTTGARYEALLPMIRRLDVAPKQILLEATIAEVSLTGDFANGVEFALRGDEGRFASGTISGGTLGNLGLPVGGISINYVGNNIADQVRLRLRASDSQVNVLSNPVIVVRDGVSANISVGNDVPTVGATASDPLVSDKTVTSVLYRNTGLQLSILPTINAQGLVVMQINQSITNTVPGSSGVEGAPTFFQRAVNTEVVAASGQSVLLAGLISESGSKQSENVPGFSRLPALGALFRSDSKKSEKTELVLLITPRIIDSPEEWGDIMGRLRNSYRYLQTPASNAESRE